jgi:outer membrane lipoprotein carrier protein
MRNFAPLVLVLVALAAPSGADADAELADPRDPTLAPSERMAALIARVRASHDRVSTMEAVFSQRKESEMLAAATEASGVFSYAAPDRVRWEYLEPDPISLLITGDEMTMWFRDLGRAEVGDVGGQAQKVVELMGASTSLDTLLEYFSVTLEVPEADTDPFRLLLEPRFKRVEKRVRELTIWVDAVRYLPFRLRFVEGDGDVTEYDFTELRINEDLPEGRFALDLPPEVKIEALRLSQGAGR